MIHLVTRILMLFLILLGSFPASGFSAQDQRRQGTLVPSIPQVQKPATVNLPPQVPKVWDTSIAETQRQLQDILQIHQTLQVQQQAQIREIQRITDQARIHQEILKGLEAGKPPGGVEEGANAKTIEETIRLQKISLIQKEARKNKIRLKRFQRKAEQEKKLKPQLYSEKPAPSTENKEGKETKSFWWWDQKK